MVAILGMPIDASLSEDSAIAACIINHHRNHTILLQLTFASASFYSVPIVLYNFP